MRPSASGMYLPLLFVFFIQQTALLQVLTDNAVPCPRHSLKSLWLHFLATMGAGTVLAIVNASQPFFDELHDIMRSAVLWLKSNSLVYEFEALSAGSSGLPLGQLHNRRFLCARPFRPAPFSSPSTYLQKIDFRLSIFTHSPTCTISSLLLIRQAVQNCKSAIYLFRQDYPRHFVRQR